MKRWPGQLPPLLSAQEGLGVQGFTEASSGSLDSTGGGTTQTRSELLHPKVSKEGRQQGVLEFRQVPRFESGIASFKRYDLGQVT